MDKGQKITLAVLAVTLALALGVLLTVLLTRDASYGEFVPPPFEEHAKTEFSSPVDEKAGYVPFGVTEEFKGALCSNVFVKDGKAEIFFTSFKESTAWARAMLLDEDGNTLGECGILKPGEHVQTVDLSYIPKANTKMTVKVLLYEPETYFSQGSYSVTVNLIVK